MEYILKKILDQTLYGTSDSDGHLMTLLGISLSMRSKNILELGVRYGDTTLPLLLSAYLNGGFLTSVDINETEFEPPFELRHNWRFIKSDAIRYLTESSLTGYTTPFDLVYVDDWHSGHHVAKELELLENLITPCGLILLHDLMYSGTCPKYHTEPDLTDGEFAYGGPFAAVNALDKDKWEWSTIPSFHGLTILRKKV